MSYLFEFIRSLNEADRLRIENLPLLGKERDVADYLLHFKRQEIDILQACRDLSLSRAHFDKISSVVLDKCYAEFYPEGGTVMIGKLVNRGLIRHALHEVKQQEKIWKVKPPTPDERAKFYNKVFRTVCRLPAVTDGKMDMVRKYGAALLKSVQQGKPLYVMQVFVASRSLIGEIELYGVTKTLETPGMMKQIEKRLAALKVQAQKVNDAYAHTQANIANIFYYNLMAPEKSLVFLEESVKLLPAAGAQLDASEQVNFHLKYAEALFFLSRFEEAYKRFLPFFKNEETHQVIVNAMRSKFIQLCIITGRLKEAEAEMQYVYARSSEEQTHRFTLMYVLSSIKLYLLWGKFERAFDYIQLMKGRLVKNVLVNYEVELRNLEAVYFYLMGDFNFAIYIAKKNLKYFSSRKEMRDTQQVGDFCRMVIKMAQDRIKQIRKYDYREDEKLVMYTQRELAYYSRILEKMDA
ncbi:MAG: hypothetical protein U0T84_05040 [Chitinophagales bacterium]